MITRQQVRQANRRALKQIPGAPPPKTENRLKVLAARAANPRGWGYRMTARRRMIKFIRKTGDVIKVQWRMGTYHPTKGWRAYNVY